MKSCCLQISAEECQKLLKDTLFSTWSESACESTVDTVKLMSLVDFYLPFFPLERKHISQLFQMKLEERRRKELQDSSHFLFWNSDVVDSGVGGEVLSEVHDGCRVIVICDVKVDCGQSTVLIVNLRDVPMKGRRGVNTLLILLK